MDRNKNPKVSVIICTVKNKKEIECLPYLKKQTNKNFEIIIRKDKGLTKARNEGIKQSRGEIIAFIDDDAIPKSDWVENIIKNLKKEKGLLGKIIPRRKNIWSKIAIFFYDQSNKKKYTSVCIGCNMAFRREVFDEVGMFDEYFDYGNDETEFIMRFLKKYKYLFSPDVIVYHDLANNLKEFLKKQYKYGLKNLYMWKKHGLNMFEILKKIFPIKVNRKNIPSNINIEKNIIKTKIFIIILLGKFAEIIGIIVNLLKKK